MPPDEGPRIRIGTNARPSTVCPSCRIDSGITRCSACNSEIAPQPVEEAWLEVPLPGGEWVAAYRLMPEEGRHVVGELRVFPNEPGRPRLGRWSAERLGIHAPIPRGGLGARLLRNVKVSDDLSYFVRHKAAGPGFAARLVKQGFTDLDVGHQGHQPGGRRGHSNLFYARIAARYVALLERGEAKPVHALQRELEEEENNPLSQATVRDLIRRARARGLLTTTTRGRPGGQLTQKAVALLQQRRGD